MTELDKFLAIVGVLKALVPRGRSRKDVQDALDRLTVKLEAIRKRDEARAEKARTRRPR